MAQNLWEKYQTLLKQGYKPLATDSDTEIQRGNTKLSRKNGRKRHVAIVACFVMVCIGAAVIAIIAGFCSNHPPKTGCIKPSIRREWRALTPDEKAEFVGAFNCLAKVPTSWRPNGTLYDDYAYLHGTIGSWSHRSSAFLPWHRYALHAWRNHLREHCNYSGEVPYWDWSLDWMNLANSSIWDPETGFGGDGDPKGPEAVGMGRCVTNGPFTGLRPIFYNHTYEEHCLSRGFNNHGTMGTFPTKPFDPESIGKMLRNDTYAGLVRHIEFLLHNEMHQAIGGDFRALTAANDPIFFLHHAQMDRLWWKWQQEQRAERIYEYNGKHMYNSSKEGSIHDYVMFGGFIPDITVSKLLDTQNGFLCYRYS